MSLLLEIVSGPILKALPYFLMGISSVLYFFSSGNLKTRWGVFHEPHLKLAGGVLAAIGGLLISLEVYEKTFGTAQVNQPVTFTEPRSVAPEVNSENQMNPPTALSTPRVDFSTPAYQVTPASRFIGTALAMSASGKFFAHAQSYLSEHYIDVYSSENGSLYTRLYGHDAIIRSLAFSDDGQFLVSGDEGGEVVVWSVAARSELRRFKDEPSDGGTGRALALPTTVAISADGSLIAYGGQTETLTVRRVIGSEVLARIPLHSLDVEQMDFGAVGLNTWRRDTLRQGGRLGAAFSRADAKVGSVRVPIVDIAFSVDNQRVAAISPGTVADLHVHEVNGGATIARQSCRQFTLDGSLTAGSIIPTALEFDPVGNTLYFSGNVAVPKGSTRGSSIRRLTAQSDVCGEAVYASPQISSMSNLSLLFDGSQSAIATREGAIVVDLNAGLVIQTLNDEQLFGYECGTTEKTLIFAGSGPVRALSACGLTRPRMFGK